MGRRYELPTIAEEDEVKSSSYESVTEEEDAPEANPTREAPEAHRMPEAAAGDRRDPPVTPARAPASRKRAAGPEEEEGVVGLTWTTSSFPRPELIPRVVRWSLSRLSRHTKVAGRGSSRRSPGAASAGRR